MDIVHGHGGGVSVEAEGEVPEGMGEGEEVGADLLPVLIPKCGLQLYRRLAPMGGRLLHPPLAYPTSVLA